MALLTPNLPGYRLPLYERLARDQEVEVLCYGGGDRYVPPWLAGDLDRQIADAGFPARRLTGGARQAFGLGRRYDAVIAPYAGGGILPAAYLGAHRYGRPFVLWASVWAQPWSVKNVFGLPLTLRIYRGAESVIAYGEHVRRFVARRRGRDDDVFVAPQSVEADVFGRTVSEEEIASLRERYELPPAPLVAYVGRLVEEKGVGVLLDAWRAAAPDATLLAVGDGPLRSRCSQTPGVQVIGPLDRRELPSVYAASEFAVLASINTPRFREPWGLVCNEAMHQRRPVLASTAVGAVAGGLVRDGETGVVVPAGDPGELADAIERLLGDPLLCRTLGERAEQEVAAYNYDAMAEGFRRALEVARRTRG
ncbi:MAG TPA: glycosyltransferase family 4 protein [Solirubrobacteraceae bacterium]|nr:glycosyltransferase family 4 protein [Solirubrobacteraceae bacterium]